MAKFYYAKMHVDVGAFVARPGEVIEGEFSEEDIARWLAIGAICECSAPEGVEYDEAGDSTPEDDAPAQEDAPESLPEEPEAETEEAEEAEPAPAVIDVMDGISAAPAPKTAAKKRSKAK